MVNIPLLRLFQGQISWYIDCVKKIFHLFLFIFITFFLSACNLPWGRQIYSAVMITSAPKATVYIDNKEKGKTPYYDENILPGEHDIRLVADSMTFSSWQGKVKFTPQAESIINRILSPTDVLSSGEIVIMEELDDDKTSELAVVTNPDGAKVVIDNQDVGLSPYAQKNTATGEHQLDISFPGYTKRILKVISKNGYRVVVNIQLAQVLSESPESLTGSTSSATISGQENIGESASQTQNQSGQPDRPRVKIMDTPTGWLRCGPHQTFQEAKSARFIPANIIHI